MKSSSKMNKPARRLNSGRSLSKMPKWQEEAFARGATYEANHPGLLSGSSASSSSRLDQTVFQLQSLLNKIDTTKPMESTGEQLGRKLGMYAGRLLGRITGSGDYSVALPSGGSTVDAASVPQFIATDNSRETRIRHREYLGDITASAVAGAFSNSVYRLNPASAKTFPWLSVIASQYEQWEPHGIAVVFKSLTSTYAASQSLGTVILATDYDVTDAPYVSKIEMDNSEFAVSGNAASNLLHPIECVSSERLTKLLMVQTDQESFDNYSRRWSDLGNLQIASQGCLASQLLGEIWVTYDISFYKPQLGRLISPPLCTMWRSTASPTASDIYGNLGTVTYESTNGVDVFPQGVNNVLSFGPSCNGYTYLVTGSVWITGAGFFSALTGATFVNTILSTKVLGSSNPEFTACATSTAFRWHFLINVIGTPGSSARSSIQFANLSSVTTIAGGSLRWVVTMVNPQIGF